MQDLQYILSPFNLLSEFRKNPDKLKQTDSLRWEHANRLFCLFNRIKDLPQVKAQKIIVNHLSDTFSDHEISQKDLYEQLTSAIIKAKGFRENLIREFVPDLDKFPFTSEGIVRATDDPVDLLKMCWQPIGDPFFHPIRSFESNVFWQLGMRYLIMRSQNKKFRPQQHLSDVTEWLEKKLFISSEGREVKGKYEIYYDKNNFNRFCSINTPSTPDSIKLSLWFRLIQNAERLIPVLYDGREKQEDDVLRKTLLKSQAEHPLVNDQSAISLIFLNNEDLEAGYAFIMENIFNLNTTITNMRLNGHGGKTKNEFTAQNFGPDKHFLVYIKGGLLEVQIYTFENYFNGRFSLGEENHRFYRLKQVRQILKMLFPRDLYVDIDWDDEERVLMMEEYQRLRAQVNFLKFKKK